MTTLRDSPGHFCPFFVIFGSVFGKIGQKWTKNGPKMIKNGSFLVDPVFGGYLIN